MTWLIRSRYIAQSPSGEGRFLLCHILSRALIVCDRSIIELLDYFQRPKRLEALIEDQGEGASLASLISQLCDLNLLRAAGNGEAERIRDVYHIRLQDTALDWALHDSTNGELTELDLTLNSSLVLSSGLATLALERGEFLVTHPLGQPAHLSGRLFALAQAFRGPACVSEVLAQQGGDDATPCDLLHACGFLFRKKLLWVSREAERQEVQKKLPSTEHGSLFSLHPPINQWRQKFQAYTLADVRRTRSKRRLALVGPCHIQQLSESLEFLAQRRGLSLALEGFLEPTPKLSKVEWSLIVLSLTQFTASFYESIAAEDEAKCRALLPGIVSQVDRAVDQLRGYTKSPILVTALGLPGLWPTQATSPFGFIVQKLFASLHTKILECISGQGDVFLLDEPRLAAENSPGVYWDDAFNALPHHAAASTWSWVTLKRGITDVPYTQAQRQALLSMPSDKQADPSAVLSSAILHFLERREKRPITLIVFEPNELLWRGRLEEHQEALTDPHYYADVEEYRYAGIHEALSVLKSRGLKLACLSSSTTELLKARWSFGDRLRHVVRLNDLCALANKDEGLANILSAAEVCQEETLLLGVEPPIGFRGQAYRDDTWRLRRFLLTAPELWPLSEAKTKREAPQEAGHEEAPLFSEAVMREVLLSQLKTSEAALDKTNDLRMLGLDSLGGLELMRRLEAKLQIRFEDHDFVDPIIFYKGALQEAVRRALQRREVGTLKSAALRTELYFGLSYEEWCQQDLPQLLHRYFIEPPTPWIYKFLSSGARFDYQHLTWKQLGELAGGYAEHYRKMGLQEGEVISLFLPQGASLLAAFTGALLGRFIPSISTHPNEKLSQGAFSEWFAKVVARSETKLIVCEQEKASLLEGELVHAGLSVSILSSEPGEAAYPPPGRARPEAMAFLQHSSGTTGLKKAILIDHKRVLSQVWELAHSLRCAPSDKIASWLPLYHDMGLISSLLIPLSLSIPAVMISPLDWVKQPELLLEQISEEQASLCWMPNFALMHCARRIREAKMGRLDLSSLRVLINGGEPVTSAAQDEFFNRFSSFGLRASALSSGYGTAETTAAITQARPGHSARRLKVVAQDFQERGEVRLSEEAVKSLELVSSGPPLERTIVEVIGLDGEQVPEGKVGQLRIKSPSSMDGYVKSPQESAEALREGWFYPGDLGFLFEGEVFVTGRESDRIIVAGRNFYCHDLEAAVSDLPGVRAGRVSAFGVFDEEEGTERVAILVETSLIKEDDKEELIKRIRATILEAFGLVAREVKLLDPGVLIKSTSGKLSRQKNRELYIKGQL